MHQLHIIKSDIRIPAAEHQINIILFENTGENFLVLCDPEKTSYPSQPVGFPGCHSFEMHLTMHCITAAESYLGKCTRRISFTKHIPLLFILRSAYILFKAPNRKCRFEFSCCFTEGKLTSFFIKYFTKNSMIQLLLSDCSCEAASPVNINFTINLPR